MMRTAVNKIAIAGSLLLLRLISLHANAGEPAAAKVSDDLLQVYARTQTATSESEFTAIARECAQVIPDKSRSKVDLEYAKRLFAWSLNRRGEVRSESAAKLVQQGALEDASKLDKQAGADFATAVQYAPDNWRMHHNLAVSQAMQGSYVDAIESFSRVISLKQDYPNAFFNRAELYFESQQYLRAISDYSAAIGLAPEDARYVNGRAHARFMLNSHEEALADYRKAAELEATNAAYLTDLADALQFVGEWEEAATRYRQAIAADKTYARAYRNVSWLLSTCPEKRFRNANMALSAAKKAIELEGESDFRTLDTLAAASAATGDAKGAATIMRRAIQSAPAEQRAELNDRYALYRRGEAYVQAAVPVSTKTASPMRSEVRTASAISKE